ncbi:putative Minor tail protein M [Vibrio coralliirubri]|uniref:phage tail protein n=1 Tax=Vibrio coralliirubri TaxID=1516159 RepID=UPI00062F661B|nr:phage tail protein [Vibrio coralliirubri]CDU05802.1 putative Minor tail protein M [Vibrio coralliirubri]
MSLPHNDLLSQNSSFQTSQSMLMIQYGDGYGQRAEDGLNNTRQIGSLVWIPLSLSERDDIQSFWRESGAVRTWLWTAPNDTERLWRFSGGISENNVGDKYLLTVEVTEEFE